LNLQPPVLETGALPIELRPSVQPQDSSRGSRHDPCVGRIGPALLFSALTLLFVVIAVGALRADQWVIAVAGVALALWMGPMAWSALRRMLR
jgi:hypothetical protein